MSNIKLVIEYDGTNYHGWQSQSNAVTVQAVVEKSLKKLTGEECRLIGASRTDVGVHALGQVANFHTDSRIPPEKFSFALNTILPEDVTIRKSEEVSMDFHSRFSSKGKTYRYLIYNSIHTSALLRKRAYHVHYPLKLEAMREAAGYLLGTHDFAAFRATGSSTKTSVRTITGVTLERQGDIIRFDISGNGFLYNMVRIIAGTLVEVGTGKLEASSIAAAIESGDRKKAGITAPAQGLYLMEVFY